MGKMLFFFLLMPLLAAAQPNKQITSFEKSIPGSLGKRIHLPEPDYTIDLIGEPDAVKRIVLIGEDSVYRKIFSHQVYKNDTLPTIDFRKSELVLYSACGLCLSVCDIASGHQSCHRPACDYQYAWFVRKKEKNQKLASDEDKELLHVLYNQKPILSSRQTSFPLLKHTDLEKHFEIGGKSCYLYKINSDSVYNAVFAWHKKQDKASVPVINFEKQELLVQVFCHQCLISYLAGRNSRENKPVHSGQCVYSARWFIVDK